MDFQMAERLGRGFGYAIATYSAKRLDAFQLIAAKTQADITLQDVSFGRPFLSIHAGVHSCGNEHTVPRTCFSKCFHTFRSLVMADGQHDTTELDRRPTSRHNNED